MAATEYLRVTDLHAFYGESHVLHGADLVVNRGEVVALLGRNGAGRTTLLRSIMGLVGRRQGSIMVNGRETIAMPTHRIASLGIGYCPEERAIFSALSCEENLMLPPVLRSGGFSVEDVYAMFPNLRDRRRSQGTRLSGGEQQMLAIARILRTGAQLLLLDEISEGLAPVIVDALEQCVLALKARGYTVLLVEQNFEFATGVADRAYVMENGRVADSLSREDLEGAKAEQVHRLLAV